MTEHAGQESEQQPEPAERPRRRLKWLWVTLAVLILVPVLLVAAILLALRSDAGTAWVLDQAPGLELTGDRGSLLGRWKAERLHWQGFGVDLTVISPEVDWSPGCLLQTTLCLDALLAERVDLVTQPGEESAEDSGAISLPEVMLPLNLDVRDIRIGNLTFNDTLVWDQFVLVAEGSGSSFNISTLSVQREDLSVDTRGWLETRGDWPLALESQIALPPFEGRDWSMAIDLSGSVRELRLNAVSQGYLEATIRGSAEPLDPDLPLQLSLDSESFHALETLPETLTLEDWTLQVDGSLARGFHTRTQASLPGERGAIDLALSGQVTTEAANDLELSLSAPYHRDGEGGDVVLTGSAGWAGEPQADAEFTLDDFPWYDLLPGMQPPPVTLRSLSGQTSYREEGYRAQLQAGVDGPLGESTLSGNVRGDMESVRLSDLDLATGAGGLSGNATVDFAGQLGWDAALSLKNFNPGYWAPDVAGDLSGDITSTGRLDDEGQPDMRAALDLTGTLREQEARMLANVTGAQGAWRVDGLDVRVGDNRIQGQGRWAEALEAQLDINLAGLDRLLPGLTGEVTGQVELGGTPQSPFGSANLQGSDLGWQDQLGIGDVSLVAELTEAQSLDGRLDLQNVEAAGQTLESLALDLAGTLEEHRLEILARHEAGELDLAFAGGWQGPLSLEPAGSGEHGWQGSLVRGQLDLPEQEQNWALEQPASLAYATTGDLRLGEHCWRWDSSTLCAGDQTLLPQPGLDLSLTDFPVSALAPLLPETLRWEAVINGRAQLGLTDAGPDGEITLDAGPGDIQVYLGETWRDLDYEQLETRLQLTPDQADLTLNLAGSELGSFGLNMQIDPMSETRDMEGSFTLEGLQLGLVGGLLDLEETRGELNGRGAFSGPLLEPEVEGELRLSDGRIVDPERLPLPLEDIQMSLLFNGQQAQLDGTWRSSDQSEGRIAGDLGWSGEPFVDLRLTGKRLPFTYEPYARLELEPDLQIQLDQGALSISGRVDVPRGDIEIQELPQQAVSVSGDEVIVGSEEEEPALQSVTMDINVVVGGDKVTFDAFDLTGNLEGNLQIGNDMDTRGNLELKEGRFEAYGQDLTLRRARIVFVGPVSQPYLDIEATRRVDTVTAGIRLSGPVTEPETEIFSEPAMSQDEALSYLILGRPLGGTGQQDQGQLGRAALSLGLAQTGELTRGLGENVGIRNLMLEAEGSGDDAAVVASGYLTDELSLRYGVGVFEPITTVALRYDLGRYFYVEAASGLASSLDIFYTRDF